MSLWNPKTWFKKPVDEEPRIEIIGSDYDPENGIKMTMDWNDAFIKQLKQSGYSGTSDEAVVQKWLQQVSQQVANRMNLDTTGDYE